MKALIVLFSLMVGFETLAQNKANQANLVQYIGSSSAKGASDAVIVNNVPLIHTKQFLPFKKAGQIVEDNFTTQAGLVFEDLSKTLKLSGSDIDQIVKLNVFLTSANLIAEFQLFVSKKFGEGKQPAITFAIGELAHPDALIAIDAVAVQKGGVDQIKIKGSTSEEGAAFAILPAGPVVYVSGQAAKGDLAQATKATLKQLSETLMSLGLKLSDIVQIKSFLTPMSSLSIVKNQFIDFFKGETIPPLVFVDWISSDPVIEIELIASSPAQAVKGQQIDYITPPGMTSSPVYSKVSRLNFGKKVYLSGVYGLNTGTTNSEVSNLFDSMGAVLRASRTDFNHLLKATYYVGNDQVSKSLGELRTKYYDPKRPPAASKAMLKEVGLIGQGISVDMIGTVKE